MLKKISFQVIVQILAAVFLLSLPLFILSGQDSTSILSKQILAPYFIFCLCFISIYLINRHLLLPKLYATKKYLFYFGALVLILAIIVVTRPFDKLIFENNRRPFRQEMPKWDAPPPPFERNADRPPHPGGPRVDIASIFLFILIVIISITQETNKQLLQTTQRALQAEAEKAQAELSFLKAQVNPHFLFNTLNNIYTLAVIKDDNTGPSVMKLSNIMRYITDEAGADFVELSNEIECITDFIALQKLRLTKKTGLTYELSGDFKHKKIAPLILMAFVENVFKYGISNHKASNLSIRITAQDTLINFYCQNAIYVEKKNTERTGIGLENTRQRLQYIYPDQHILNIKNDDGFFTVNLTIHLS